MLREDEFEYENGVNSLTKTRSYYQTTVSRLIDYDDTHELYEVTGHNTYNLSPKRLVEYDKENFLMKHTFTDSLDNISDVQEVRYDKSMNMIERKVFQNNEIFQHEQYEYNVNNELIKLKITNRTTVIISNYQYTKHDKNGNWIERIPETKNKQYLTTREIKYY